MARDTLSGETAVDGRNAAQGYRTLQSTAPSPAQQPHSEVVAYGTTCMRTHCPAVRRQPRCRKGTVSVHTTAHAPAKLPLQCVSAASFGPAPAKPPFRLPE